MTKTATSKRSKWVNEEIKLKVESKKNGLTAHSLQQKNVWVPFMEPVGLMNQAPTKEGKD